MKTKLSVLVSFTALTIASLKAETPVENAIAKATANPTNSISILGWTAVEHPESVGDLTTKALNTFPDKAEKILAAILKAAPKQAKAIVSAAIKAQPDQAVSLTKIAVNTLPDRTAEIIKAAMAETPESIQAEIAAIVPSDEARASSAPRSTTPFPRQSIRPDLVSPSS